MIIYDPILQLDNLKDWLSYAIEREFKCLPFLKWMKEYRSERVYGTQKYYRAAATHCYYCEKPLNSHGRTIDHFYPKTLGTHRIYSYIRVICCRHCNAAKKGGMHPDDFIRMVTVANMTGRQINGYTGKDLERIAKNANTIFNDVLLGNHKPVYWLSKTKSFLPKGFKKIDERIISK